MISKYFFFIPFLLLCFSLSAQQMPLGFEFHKVRSGETLFGISKMYNISQEELQEYNPILSKTGLRKRMKIRIPIFTKPEKNVVQQDKLIVQQQDSVVWQKHVVQPKETKWRLAYQYGITIASLEEKNPEIKNGLKIGQILQVPLLPKLKVIPEKDTLFNYYMVLPKEGYFRIEKKLGITKEVLDSLNPQLLEKGLQEGMVLKIPTAFTGDLKVTDDLLLERVNLFDSLVQTKPLKMALMLPFRATEFNLDSLHLVRPLLEKRNLYTVAFDFYMGAFMAAEKVTTLGIPITINTIDTENNKNKIREAVNSQDWRDTDVIIGPIIPSNFDYMSSFNQVENIPKITPLSSNAVKKRNAVFQTHTQKNVYREKMLSFLEKKLDSTQNIVIVADSLNRPMEIKLLKKFPSAIRLRPEKEGYLIPDLVDSLLVDSLPNKVIFETSSFPLIASVLSQMNAQNTSVRSVQVFTTYRDNLYDKVDVDLKILGGIGFTYPSNTINKKTDQFSDFELSYLNKFGKPPSKEATRAYDVTLDILLRLAYGETLNKSISIGETFYEQNSFLYAQDQNNSYINQAVLILQHQGYQIKELKEWE